MGYHGSLTSTHVPSYVRVGMTRELWQRNTDDFIVMEGDWCTSLGINSVLVAEYNQDSAWSSRHVFRDAERNRRQTRPEVAVIGSFSQGQASTPTVVKSFSDFRHRFGPLGGIDNDLLTRRRK